MKTPVMRGFPGLFLAMLWFGSPLQGDTNNPAPALSQTIAVPAPAGGVREHSPAEFSVVPRGPALSPWTAEIVKLARSGIDENVMRVFVDNAGAFGLGADQIIYLSDLGISGELISAMLQHDRELAAGERLATTMSAPPTDSFFGVTLVQGRDSTSGAVKEIPATPAAVAAMVAAGATREKRAPAAARPQPSAPATPDAAPATETEAAFDASAPAPAAPTEPKRPLYPVRAPYPEQLLPPIIFVHAPEIPPNTLIVYGFPRS
jgi:hypothetical protein